MGGSVWEAWVQSWEEGPGQASKKPSGPEWGAEKKQGWTPRWEAGASASAFSAADHLRGCGQVTSLLQTLCLSSEEGRQKLRAELPTKAQRQRQYRVACSSEQSVLVLRGTWASLWLPRGVSIWAHTSPSCGWLAEKVWLAGPKICTGALA